MHLILHRISLNYFSEPQSEIINNILPCYKFRKILKNIFEDLKSDGHHRNGYLLGLTVV